MMGRVRWSMAVMLLAIHVFFSAPALAAGSDGARRSTCALMTAILSSGTTAARRELSAMTSWWPDLQRVQIGNAFGVLGRYSYSSGDVFRITDFRPHMVEHLVVMTAVGAGAHYFRLTYETLNGEFKLVNLAIETSWNKMITRQIPQPPVKLNCGA